MMTRPSSDQLIAIIRAELPNVATLGEQDRGELLGLLDGLLATVEQRARHEATWIVEESEQIDQLAEFLVQGGHDPDRWVARTMSELSSLQGTRPDALLDGYHVRSQLLSECVPVAMAAGGDARVRLESVIDTRIAHEAQIRGELALVARG